MPSNLSESERDVVAQGLPLDPRVVREQMERIVLSSHFRQSRRYPILLRYVVERTLDGHAEDLKERTLGVEVFQRTPDYDTNIDPIVRITAGEVRKRIAQYYHDDGHADELRIDLPAGSYVPQFRLKSERHIRPQAAAGDEPPDAMRSFSFSSPSAPVASVPPGTWAPARRSQGILFVAFGLLAVLVCAGAWWLLRAKPAALEAIWSPMFASNAPLLISAGVPELLNGVADQSDLTVREHVYLRDLMVFSDVTALAALASFSNARHHAYKLQISSATTFADLRSGPVILLGGYDNPWTMRLVDALRYRFRRDTHGHCWIEDVRSPGDHKWEVDFNESYAKLGADYAIVARFTDENTHQPVMIAAGIGENGTKAAAEFLTDPAVFQSLLGIGATALASSNFEVVLQTTVISGVSGQPRLLTKEVW